MLLAGTNRAQREIPALGRLPLVPDHRYPATRGSSSSAARRGRQEANRPGQPPPTTREPSPQPQPSPSRPQSRRDALVKLREDGAKILAALRDPAYAIRTYGRIPTDEDVDSWEENVRDHLRDKGDLLKLFDYEPLEAQPPSGSLKDLLTLKGLAAAYARPHERLVTRVERRLAQLDKVIERL